MLSSIKLSVARFARNRFVAKPARSDDELAVANAGPLVIAGLFRTASGIGESARACANGFEAHGRTVIRCDLSGVFGQIDLPDDPILQPFPNTNSGIVIVHLNAPELLKGMLALGLTGGKKWRVIGNWVWELETIPPLWRESERHVSEIWTPSVFSADALKKSIQLSVRVVPPFVHAPEYITEGGFRQGIAESDIVTLVMADSRSSFDRKNVFGAISAFLAGVGANKNCWLIVKTRNLRKNEAAFQRLANIAVKYPRIRILDTSLSQSDKWSLLSACDIFLSLHRSEGFGLVIAEAMALGMPVVATAWSGNMDLMFEEGASCPIRFELRPVQDQTGIYFGEATNRWAEPDEHHAAEQLARLSKFDHVRRSIGVRAQTIIKKKLDGSEYLTALASE